jgi:hypothetical protein
VAVINGVTATGVEVAASVGAGVAVERAGVGVATRFGSMRVAGALDDAGAIRIASSSAA